MEAAPSDLGDQPHVEEHSRIIDCPVSVLQKLRTAVLEQFNSTPHGGEEVTGVLFGTRRGEEVRIAACCTGMKEGDLQKADGLSERQRTISGVIAAASGRKELEGMEPLGWFRAHPRTDLGLTSRDLEIANALFPQLWQLVLVMRPANSSGSRVCFYFREGEGQWTARCSVRAFTLPAPEAVGTPEPAHEGEELAEQDEGAVATVDLSPHLSALLTTPEPKQQNWIPATVVVLAAVVLAAGGYYYYNYGQRPQALGLSVRGTDSASQVRIAWDGTSRRVRDARAAYVTINDGGENERVDLDASQREIGYLNYQRHSNDLTVHLMVVTADGTPAEEVTRFAAPQGSAGQASPGAQGATETGQEGASAENAGTPGEKTPEMVVPVPVEEDDGASESPAERPKFQPPTTKPEQKPVPEETPAPPVTAPAQVAHSAPSSVQLPVIHTAPPPEKAPEPAPARPVTASTTSAPTTPQQNATRAAVTPRTPAAVPTSGRVIWIGRLQKNEPVTINGKNSSTGTVIGELPGRAVRFVVSPGDLASDGIVLYSSNMQYANSVVEPPSAHNGWNKTVYTLNPKLANDVSVDETPTAQNGWSRIVLRSKNPKISVIVIDWTLVN